MVEGRGGARLGGKRGRRPGRALLPLARNGRARYGGCGGGGGPERHGSLEPLATLAGLAAATERVRLGTLVLSAGFRHPAVLAKRKKAKKEPTDEDDAKVLAKLGKQKYKSKAIIEDSDA